MLETKPINILAYIAGFGGILPPLAGYYASKRGAGETGLMLGGYMDGGPCGVLIADFKGESAEIVYIAVSEPYRRMGVCKALVGECIGRAKSKGKQRVRLRYSPENFNDWFGGYLGRAGFASRTALTTVVIPVEEHKGEWNAFMSQRGEKLTQKLRQKGYTATSFADTKSEVFERLYAQIGGKFPSFLDPRKCPNTILDRHSFITTHNGEPAAYIVTTSADGGQTAIIEYMAASEDYRNKGAFLLCLAAVLESLCSEGKCKKVSYAFEEHNKTLPKVAAGDWFSGKTVKVINEYWQELKENTSL